MTKRMTKRQKQPPSVPLRAGGGAGEGRGTLSPRDRAVARYVTARQAVEAFERQANMELAARRGMLLAYRTTLEEDWPDALAELEGAPERGHRIVNPAESEEEGGEEEGHAS